tara:strand:- start:245 stop:403 length:159 start_codon:yes stop_codon:yes gene_type:complete
MSVPEKEGQIEDLYNDLHKDAQMDLAVANLTSEERARLTELLADMRFTRIAE